MLKADQISYKAGGKCLLEPTTVSFAPGRFHVVMGANGAGKSTMIRALSGDLSPATGHVYLSGTDIRNYSRAALAKKRAVLSQHYEIQFPITVDEVIMMGRYPYFKTRPSEHDRAICNLAKDKMHIAALSERDYLTLSGGEAQKVQMCRVLAQIGQANTAEGKVLFLDEPVSHLDLKYQYQLLQVAKNLCAGQAAVVAVLHDINLALAFADRILFMKQGKIVYDIDDVNTLPAAVIEDVFDVKARIYSQDGKLMVMIDRDAFSP